MLPNEGSHSAKLNGQIVVYETEAGALCLAVPVRLTTEVAWTGKSTQTLVKQDGTVNTRCLDEMKKIFGDPMDAENKIYRFADVAETALTEIPGADVIAFDVIMEHRQGEKDAADGGKEQYTYASVKYLNPAGGSVKMPEPISRKDVMTKYGSKFKALGSAVKKPASIAAKVETKKPVETKMPPPAKTPPSKRKADDVLDPTASQDEAWESLVKQCPKLGEEKQGEIWYGQIEKMFPGKEAGALGLKDFGALKAFFESADFDAPGE